MNECSLKFNIVDIRILCDFFYVNMWILWSFGGGFLELSFNMGKWIWFEYSIFFWLYYELIWIYVKSIFVKLYEVFMCFIICMNNMLIIFGWL